MKPCRARDIMAKKQAYGNESITTLKGAERVRKRPAVIFGSDGLDGCEHAVFEILSNAIDEAREGYGKLFIRKSSIHAFTLPFPALLQAVT